MLVLDAYKLPENDFVDMLALNVSSGVATYFESLVNWVAHPVTAESIDPDENIDLTVNVTAEGVLQVRNYNQALAASVGYVLEIWVTVWGAELQCWMLDQTGGISVDPLGCSSAKTSVWITLLGGLSCPRTIVDFATGNVAPTWEAPIVSSTDLFSPELEWTMSVSHPLGTEFAVGTETTVTYTAESSLDLSTLGAYAPKCSFKVVVAQGNDALVTSPGHLIGPDYKIYEFLIDDTGSTGATASTSPLVLSLDKGFQFRAYPPEGELFTVTVPEGSSVAIFFSLHWCHTGSTAQYPLLSYSAYLHVDDIFALDPLDSVVSIELDSYVAGVSANRECFGMQGWTKPVTKSFSFFGLRLELGQSMLERRAFRRVASSDPFLYLPASFNQLALVFNHTNDQGSLLNIQDTDPPEFTFCPSNIQVEVLAGQLGTEVSWADPTAVDNVGVIMSSTHAPGDFFSLQSSPATVVYTARDPSGLEDHCSFTVTLTFEPTALVVNVTLQQSDLAYSGLTTTPLGQLVAEDVVLSATTTTLDIDADLSTVNAVVINLLAPEGERWVINTLARPVNWRLSARLWWRTGVTSVTQLTSAWATANVTSADLNAATVPSTRLLGVQALAGEREDLPSHGFGDAWVRRPFSQSVHAWSNGTITSLSLELSTFAQSTAVQFEGVQLRLTFPQGIDATQQQLLSMSPTSRLVFSYTQNNAANIALLQGQADTAFLEIRDVIPPDFGTTCPDNFNITTEPGEDYGIVTFTPPTFTDNRGVVAVTASHEPGAQLNATSGSHVIQYVAYDNASNTRTCAFVVHVLDNEPPSVTCPSNVSQAVDGGQAYATIAEASRRPAAVSDNVPGDVTTTALSPAQGAGSSVRDDAGSLAKSAYTIGVHHLRLWVRDEADNYAWCPLTFEVVDPEPPVLSGCPTDLVVTASSVTGQAVVNFASPLTSDNSGDAVTVTYSHMSGTPFPEGTTTVTLVATDASGNNATCTFLVTVEASDVNLAQGAASSTDTTVVGSATGGSVAAVVTVGVVLALWLRVRNRKPANFEPLIHQLEAVPGLLEEGEMAKTPRELKRAHVTRLENIGAGNFGEVFKGLYKEHNHGYLVAIKSLHGGLQADRDEILRESCIMAQFDHPHIVSLVGVCTVGDPLLMVVEYMEHGSLASYIKKQDLPVDTMMILARDVADGLAYLASRSFVHRDIAARNILVSSERRAKVGDFGMSRDTEEAEYYTSRGGQLPVRWTAPEALESRKFSSASDCWSYGVLLYELFTKAELPYKGWSNQKVWMSVLTNYRLPCPENCPDEVHGMMLRCWAADPKERPPFTDIVEFFTGRVHAPQALVKHDHHQGLTVADAYLPLEMSDGTVATAADYVSAPDNYIGSFSGRGNSTISLVGGPPSQKLVPSCSFDLSLRPEPAGPVTGARANDYAADLAGNAANAYETPQSAYEMPVACNPEHEDLYRGDAPAPSPRREPKPRYDLGAAEPVPQMVQYDTATAAGNGNYELALAPPVQQVYDLGDGSDGTLRPRLYDNPDDDNDSKHGLVASSNAPAAAAAAPRDGTTSPPTLSRATSQAYIAVMPSTNKSERRKHGEQ